MCLRPSSFAKRHSGCVGSSCVGDFCQTAWEENGGVLGGLGRFVFPIRFRRSTRNTIVCPWKGQIVRASSCAGAKKNMRQGWVIPETVPGHFGWRGKRQVFGIRGGHVPACRYRKSTIASTAGSGEVSERLKELVSKTETMFSDFHNHMQTKELHRIRSFLNSV